MKLLKNKLTYKKYYIYNYIFTNKIKIGNHMQTIQVHDDYIKLGQALKAAGFVSSGVEAKIVIQNGEVKVNGTVETQRGKKLVGGEIVEFKNNQLKIEK